MPREYACAAKPPNASAPTEYSLDFSMGARKVSATKSVQWLHAPGNLSTLQQSTGASHWNLSSRDELVVGLRIQKCFPNK